MIKRLGVGGMAEVLLARQVGPEGFHKQVAMKRILPHLASDPAFVEMFLREARVAAQISHPNAVQIYDLCRTGNDYVILMEYVPGWNLDELIKTGPGSAARCRSSWPAGWPATSAPGCTAPTTPRARLPARPPRMDRRQVPDRRDPI